ncbi:MAG: hypothetical protein HC890_02565 [Chloroflexaceae bacterium]|nr:hypothetical protein [Chloroflexaceae bacterium]
MTNPAVEICPACGVKIIAGQKVIFSAGSPGDRAILWARVCQFAKKPGCINQDAAAIAGAQVRAMPSLKSTLFSK